MASQSKNFSLRPSSVGWLLEQSRCMPSAIPFYECYTEKMQLTHMAKRQSKSYRWLWAPNRYILVFGIIACLFILSVACLAQTEYKNTAKRDREDLFSLLDKLEKSIPWTSDVLAKVTDRRFMRNPEYGSSDDKLGHYCTEQDLKRLVSKIFVRNVDKLNSWDCGSVMLEINSKLKCITIEDVKMRYGKETSMDEPPKDSRWAGLVADYSYARPWGYFIFEVSHGESHCLTRIILDGHRVYPCGGIIGK